MIGGRALGTFFSMFLHLASSSIFMCRDSIFLLMWDAISRCLSKSLTLSPIFWISVNHSNLTSCSSSCCYRIFSLRGTRLSSNFLILFISSLKLMSSSFNFKFFYSSCTIFSFNTDIFWEVAWVKDTEAIATITWSSLVFSNNTSSSCISSNVPSSFFTSLTLFWLTSFLWTLKVKAPNIDSMV